MVKYIGSKRTLIPKILGIVQSLPEVTSVVDFFSGTSRVGHALKAAGYRVISNDLMTYAYTLATCYVQTDREDVIRDATKLIAEFDLLSGSPGYFTETFCERSRFFQPKNGERIDAIREAIERKGLDPELKAVVLVSLMEAADRVDSTTGVQMAYLKSWASRSDNDLHLRIPELLPRPDCGKCKAHQLEAQTAAKTLTADLAYIDPPYNQHSYLGNYHIWESLVRWDKPEVYGIACKRMDCRERKSDFNMKKLALDAMRRFIDTVQCRFLVVSFNNEGYIPREEMEALLSVRGDVYTVENDFKRYVGAQIGIHNPQGEKVGSVSHLRNTEYLYVVVPAGYTWKRNTMPASSYITDRSMITLRH
ncbi:MAG: DNA adenine methylase [Phycisphaeraceae bacterium]|nr:DNA adenine methylase [Phycisphaerales bacterium]MCB9860444.1 DNA adenine methylase [Phycisphaeraceae bacterium]